MQSISLSDYYYIATAASLLSQDNGIIIAPIFVNGDETKIYSHVYEYIYSLNLTDISFQVHGFSF